MTLNTTAAAPLTPEISGLAAPGLNPWDAPPAELRNHTMDSRRWHSFKFRDDDIIIGTWAKSGTTWLQQIISQLIFRGAPGLPICDISPWVEQRVYPLEKMLALLEEQPHRRFVKTHLPADALVFSPRAKYIYIGRPGLDVLWSWFHHHINLTDFAYELTAAVPDRVGPPFERPAQDFRQYFNEWLDRDGYPVWPFWRNVRSWWEVRDRPNVLLVHFSDLKADLPGQVRRIAGFLDMAIDESLMPTILEHSSFQHMKENASKLSWYLDKTFTGGAQTFINKGTGGNWHGLLTAADLQKYQRYVSVNLTPECARWLATGESGA